LRGTADRHSRRDAGSPERLRSAGREAGVRAGGGLPAGREIFVGGWGVVGGAGCVFVVGSVRCPPVSREYPSQCRTGNTGYFANRESTNDNLQRENVEPRLLVITCACAQVAHNPRWGGG